MNVTEMHRHTASTWDKAADLYERKEARIAAVLQQGGTSLRPPEAPFLAQVSPTCSRAIHLQCAAGADTLSLWKLGASEVIGVDISERLIASARRTAARLGARADWYCCDVLHTPSELDGTADLVYTGKGAIMWIMDLAAWARVIARLLRPGGQLYMFEGHPLDWVWENFAKEFAFDPRDGHYFSEQKLGHYRWPAQYIDRLGLPEDQKPVAYERQWTLSQIMNSLLDAGLELQRFDEYPEPYWNQFPNMAAATLVRLPHSFALRMRKPPAD